MDNLNVFNLSNWGDLMDIVIAGGSGQIGRLLAGHLRTQGHRVIVLSRRGGWTQGSTVAWNGRELGAWTDHIEGADLVINLAGRSVNCRYHERNRREILESRVLSTRVVGQAIARARRPPALWLNASTATIYRHAMDRPMEELTGELGGNEPGAPGTWNFSIEVAKSWEREFFAAHTPQTRKVALRSAMVMIPDHGGIFATLRMLARVGLGGRAGCGNQFVSWIHHADFTRAIDFLIANQSLEGAVNVSSPNPLAYSDFMSVLRRASGVPIGLPATKWMLEIGAFFLRTETELVLKSRRVVPRRLLEAGFEFVFPEWPAAAQDLAQNYGKKLADG